eukprot:TRINITY_DN38041_c0_g1_i2.p1 TRINITY_DN38041_c0_g1~~TRINITY_DN38041_c0_g1_i2.p1  ORF type:complete len:109 (+),score=27.23 TRINITY_DN38041_c0_g1_i2:48-329(+)
MILGGIVLVVAADDQRELVEARSRTQLLVDRFEIAVVAQVDVVVRRAVAIDDGIAIHLRIRADRSQCHRLVEIVVTAQRGLEEGVVLLVLAIR